MSETVITSSSEQFNPFTWDIDFDPSSWGLTMRDIDEAAAAHIKTAIYAWNINLTADFYQEIKKLSDAKYNAINSDGSITTSRLVDTDMTWKDAWLYMNNTRLWYWSWTEWKAFIGNGGNFSFDWDANNYIRWNWITLSILWNLSATTGTIGWWTIWSTAIYLDGSTDALSSWMASWDYPFYAWKKYADRAQAPFRVTPAGAVTMTSATITGWVIDWTTTIWWRTASIVAWAIDSSWHFADSAISTATSTIITPFTFGVSWALQIWTYEAGVTWDLKISPTWILWRDKDNNTTFSIDATTWVAVLNWLVVWTNVDIWTAEDATWVVTIIDSTVTAPYIYALNVSAQQIDASVSISSPIINGWYITLNGSWNIRWWQTDFAIWTWFFLWYSSTDYKFSIWDASNYITWDWDNLRIKWNLELSWIFNNVSYLVADLPIPATEVPAWASWNNPSWTE